jgi:hypothetical protein
MIWKLFLRLKIFLGLIWKAQFIQLIVAACLILYLLGFLFLYYHWGVRVVGWETHLLFPIYLYFLGCGFIVVLAGMGLIKHRKRIQEHFAYYIWLIWFIEFIILLTGIGKIRNEASNGRYMAYHAPSVNFFHTWPAANTHLLSGKEFAFHRTTNSLGFADSEWEKTKRPGSIRILCAGDSFTEGDAAHTDSSYVAFLRRSLEGKYEHIEVMNAGTCGSDPFFNYINLKDRLVAFQPDIVIQTISSNDLFHDYPQRGGMERFMADGTVQYRAAPWWEPLYAMSYIIRIFASVAGYQPDLTKKNYVTEHQTDIEKEFSDFFNAHYIRHALQNRYDLIIVALPMKEEVAQQKLRFNFQGIAAGIQGVYTLDLLPCYIDHISQVKQTPDSFYWTFDSHHNHAGYEMMAGCIEKGLLPVLEQRIGEIRGLSHEVVN